MSEVRFQTVAEASEGLVEYRAWLSTQASGLRQRCGCDFSDVQMLYEAWEHIEAARQCLNECGEEVLHGKPYSE